VGPLLAKFEQSHPQAQGSGDAGPLVGSADKTVDGAGDVDLSCLQHVPDVFRARDFDLKSPSTFAAVFGCATEQDPGHDSGGDELLDQLHLHLDEVEAALMRGVLSRSGEFFAAIDQLQLLSLDVASALQDTSIARSALATVDREVVGSALQVPSSSSALMACDSYKRAGRPIGAAQGAAGPAAGHCASCRAHSPGSCACATEALGGQLPWCASASSAHARTAAVEASAGCCLPELHRRRAGGRARRCSQDDGAGVPRRCLRLV
jgi:hypothetical protein